MVVGGVTGRLQAAGQALKHELVVWAWISAYLFVLFATILLYGWAKAGGEGRALTEISLAAVQAVVLGKFVLFGKIFGLGALPTEEPLIRRVLRRTLGILLVVVAFVALEEMVVSLLHGGTAMEGLRELLSRGLVELGVTMVLMFLLLTPLSVLIEFARHIPPAELRRMLFGRGG
jgi:hypothetical protein